MKKNHFYILKLKQLVLPFLLIIFTICLVIFSNTNLYAAQSGLLLWANSIVPTLFPFFVATELLSHTNFTYYLGKILNKFMKPIFNFFRIPQTFYSGFISGIIELTNGLNIICNIPEKNISINIIIASFLLGLGGISVLLQVWSCISKTDLSITPYILGKILQACFSALYTWIFINIVPFLNFNL